MKVLIVNTLYYPYKIGGAEISTQVLVEEFSKLGIEVGVLTLGEAFDENVNINDINVSRLKLENRFWPFSTKNESTISKLRWHIKDAYNKSYDDKILKILETFTPDIVHTNNLSGFSTRIWELAKSKQIKVVHTLRDYYLQCPKTTKNKNGINCKSICLDCKVLTFIKKRTSSKVDYVVGISKFILDEHLKEGYFKNVKSEVIYNGFKFNFEPEKIKFLSNSNVVFGYIGQINKQKGVELALEGFRSLKKDHENKWKLLVAGNVKTEYLDVLKGINNSNNIKYLGYTNSQVFFHSIDVLIVPSLWNEPFGRVILEAILNNKIVITSNNGGIAEIMENNKHLVFNSNRKDLSNLLDQIIIDREQTKFNNNLEFMEKFNITKTVSRYINIFSKI
ncbi:glycosyltransferase family 4 protein [Algibacter lectus]|uniref:glycosyltransferase family 4 protein n=1 Tax=Algibacter lectus TaxID=221126 RepID=UPI0026F0CBBD|nr:glycosyltransferase family 4 protein [Algibacter lectus]MDO7137096.1 glycosyltransferase family 4 protein [Algibacter lectus]